MLRRLVPLAVVLALGVDPALAQDSAIPSGPRQKDDAIADTAPQTAAELNARLEQLFGASEPFAEAFSAIQAAIVGDDRETVAQWVAYPFHVSYDDQEIVAETPEDFIAEYDEIVTDDIVEAVAGQQYDALFANDEGVMVGDGQMWLTMICRDEACARSDVRISAIQSVIQ